MVRELRRYERDAISMAKAPAHWDRHTWLRFAEGTGAVATVFAADKPLYDAVQRNRNHTTDDFARTVTPWGAKRAEGISALLIVAGSWSGNAEIRDAGRDSLESEIFAAGIVTPVIKRMVGRSRPIQQEGTHSFHPLSGAHQSFPSGHATNAFAFATAVAAHSHGWLVPTIVYSMATSVALSRVNDEKHFPSDVLAAALIGRAVAKGVVYRHQHGAAAWEISPAMFGDAPGISVHIVVR